jgi:hypothetical protein
VRGAVDQQAGQIADLHETAPVGDRGERERPAAIRKAHQALDIGLCPGSQDQRRANDHHRDARLGGDDGKRTLGLELRARIRVGRRGRSSR